MLTLHHNANTIVTDADFSVKLKWVNPACFMDAIPGDVGLGLEISVNEYTRAEFGNPERFERFDLLPSSRRYSGVAIRFNGFLLMSGTLVITNATTETYSCWLQSELGVLGSKERDRFITDIAMPEDQTFVNKMASAYDPETDTYAAELIENYDFWEGKGRQENVDYPYYDENSDPQIRQVMEYRLSTLFKTNKYGKVNRESGGAIDVAGEGVVVSPQLYLHSATKELLRSCGFFIDDTANFLKSTDLLKLLIYNNYNLMYQTFTVSRENAPHWNSYLNIMENVAANFITNTTWSVGTFDYASLLPKVSLKDFILGLQNWQNIIFQFLTDRTVRVIDRNAIPDAEAYDLDQYFMGDWILGDQKDFILKFMQEMDDNDSSFSDDWHDLSDRRADFGTPVQDFADLADIPSPFMGELRMVLSENKIYEYTWSVLEKKIAESIIDIQSDVLEWKQASIGPQAYFYRTGDKEIEEIKTSVAPIFMINNNPSVRQKGNIKSMKSLWADFKLRCIYQGIDNNPMLLMDGSSGLFARRWANWSRFWATRLPVEGEFLLPLNELNYIIRNITQPYSTRHGKFLIEELECDFKGDQIGTVKVKGYKL